MCIRYLFILCLVARCVFGLGEDRPLARHHDTSIFPSWCDAGKICHVVFGATVITCVGLVVYSSVGFGEEVASLDLNITSRQDIVAPDGPCQWGQPRWFREYDHGDYMLINTTSNVQIPYLVEMVNKSASLLAQSCKELICLAEGGFRYCLVCFNTHFIDSYKCDIKVHRQYEMGRLCLKYLPGWVIGGAGIAAYCAFTLPHDVATKCRDTVHAFSACGNYIKNCLIRREDPYDVLLSGDDAEDNSEEE